MTAKKKCKISIDTYRCKGCGVCPEILSEVFRMNETTEKTEVMKKEAGFTEQQQQVVTIFPTSCIEIEW